jgi:hypothetical protein
MRPRMLWDPGREVVQFHPATSRLSAHPVESVVEADRPLGSPGPS